MERPGAVSVSSLSIASVQCRLFWLVTSTHRGMADSQMGGSEPLGGNRAGMLTMALTRIKCDMHHTVHKVISHGIHIDQSHVHKILFRF